MAEMTEIVSPAAPVGEADAASSIFAVGRSLTIINIITHTPTNRGYFLSPHRPGPGVGHLEVMPNAYVLAMEDFDVDEETGFLPSQPPLSRLPPHYDAWEQALDNASALRMKLGERDDLTSNDRVDSAEWRRNIREMSTLGTENLTRSEAMLRRAHHVLTFILHLYVHSMPPLPPCSEIHIPQSLSIPLLQVCGILELPPILTYSDNVLYNWDFSPPEMVLSSSRDPTHRHIQTTFTGTPDEEHFYLTSLRIELAGVPALSLLKSMTEDASGGDLLSLRRLSEHLVKLANIMDAMTAILNDVRRSCNPTVFYEQIRPWFRGQSSRPWIFEGTRSAGLTQPSELAGPSAGQSSLIHVLDIFLGVDQFSHSHVAGGIIPRPPLSAHGPEKDSPFLERIQSYMPRDHRAFLNHLKTNPRPLRDIVMAEDAAISTEELRVRETLRNAYNAAVIALKGFRDAHVRIATLYIINQVKRVPGGQREDKEVPVARGTGGSDLVPFLKGVRDKTAAAILPPRF